MAIKVAGLSARSIAGGVVLVGNILVRVQVPVEVVGVGSVLFLEEGERKSVLRKWRNGTAPSVDKIKSDDKTVSLRREPEKGGCVTVVCRVTRVITVARLLARTP